MKKNTDKISKKKLRILACKPRLAMQTIKLNHLIRCEPLELEYLYTVLEHHNICLLDGIVDSRNPVKLAKKLKSQVVLFTSYITNITSVLQTAKQLKTLDNPPLIFVGGPHAEVLPEHFYSGDIDGVFFANQLDGIVKVTNRIVEGKPFNDIAGAAFPINGKFVRNPSPILDPLKLPRPKHFLLEKFPERYNIIYYKPCAAIKTSFGCVNNCTFCFCTEMNGGTYGARSIIDVIDEIEEITVYNIIILDDDFLTSKKRLLEFCELIKERGIKKEFIVIGNARFIANNPDVMGKLREAGVTAIMVGFEFVTDKELNNFDKNATLSDNNQTIKICKEADIDLFALFIVDPDWTHDEFRNLANYIRNNYLPFALFSTLTVFPGTKLAETIKPQENPLKWWRYDLLRLHQKPKHISVFSYYLWLFYLYMIPGMQFAALKKFREKYGIFGIIRHAVLGFIMGLEYLFKLLFWK